LNVVLHSVHNFKAVPIETVLDDPLHKSREQYWVKLLETRHQL